MPKTNANRAPSSSRKKNEDTLEIKPYNRYNIFYILERELFLQSNSEYQRKRKDAPTIPPNFVTGYECIDLPELPPRYANLDLNLGWYMPGKSKFKKRHHKKTHGLASFQDLARLVAHGYKNIDDATLEYITTVATLLKQRHKVLMTTRKNHMERSAAFNVSNPLGDKIVEHHVTQPSPIVSAPAQPRLTNMSDFVLNSATAADPTTTTNDSSLSNIMPVKFCQNNSCSDAPQAQGVLRSASISEVDIDDRVIMAMWHFKY